jgi:hypothetical protein
LKEFNNRYKNMRKEDLYEEKPLKKRKEDIFFDKNKF